MLVKENQVTINIINIILYLKIGMGQKTLLNNYQLLANGVM